MHQAEEFRSGLERKVRAKARHGWDKARKQWDRPLPEPTIASLESRTPWNGDEAFEVGVRAQGMTNRDAFGCR